MIYIYGLCRDGDEISDIRYIGQTNNPKARLAGHRNDKGYTRKARWIKSLRKNGHTVNMVILDSAESRAEANAIENAWILLVQRRGWNLVNSTSPGSHRDMFSPDMSMVEQAMLQVEEYAEQLSQANKDYEVRLDQLREDYTIRLNLAGKAISDLQLVHKQKAELAQKKFAEAIGEKHEIINLYRRSISDLNMSMIDLCRQKTMAVRNLDQEKKKFQTYRSWQKTVRRNQEIHSMMIDTGMSVSTLIMMAAAVLVSSNHILIFGASPNEIVSMLTAVGAVLVVRPTINAVRHKYKETRRELQQINLRYERRLINIQKLSISGVVKVK